MVSELVAKKAELAVALVAVLSSNRLLTPTPPISGAEPVNFTVPPDPAVRAPPVWLQMPAPVPVTVRTPLAGMVILPAVCAKAWTEKAAGRVLAVPETQEKVNFPPMPLPAGQP